MRHSSNLEISALCLRVRRSWPRSLLSLSLSDVRIINNSSRHLALPQRAPCCPTFVDDEGDLVSCHCALRGCEQFFAAPVLTFYSREGKLPQFRLRTGSGLPAPTQPTSSPHRKRDRLALGGSAQYSGDRPHGPHPSSVLSPSSHGGRIATGLVSQISFSPHFESVTYERTRYPNTAHRVI